MATLHRIYLGTGKQTPATFRDENGINLYLVEAAILFSLDAHGISGATLIRATGVWEGVTEPSIVIELLDDGRDGFTESVRGVALSLKRKFNQDSILVTTQEVTAAFL